MCQSQNFLFDSLNTYFELLRYNCEVSWPSMVAEGSINASTWKDCEIRLALTVATHIKNTFFSYLPFVYLQYIFIIILLSVTEKI